MKSAPSAATGKLVRPPMMAPTKPLQRDADEAAVVVDQAIKAIRMPERDDRGGVRVKEARPARSGEMPSSSAPSRLDCRRPERARPRRGSSAEEDSRGRPSGRAWRRSPTKALLGDHRRADLEEAASEKGSVLPPLGPNTSEGRCRPGRRDHDRGRSAAPASGRRRSPGRRRGRAAARSGTHQAMVRRAWANMSGRAGGPW